LCLILVVFNFSDRQTLSTASDDRGSTLNNPSFSLPTTSALQDDWSDAERIAQVNNSWNTTTSPTKRTSDSGGIPRDDNTRMSEFGGRRSVIPRPMHSGFIDLRDIILVDFAPQSFVTNNSVLKERQIDPKRQICFQICVQGGRRFTLAADENTAIEWVAQLSWYVTAARCV
jgi:hypothetical protein